MCLIACKQALHFERLAKPAARERGSEWQSSEARGTPLFRAFASPFAFRLRVTFHLCHLTLALPQLLLYPPLPPTPKWELGEVSLVRSCESWKQISLTFVATSETSVNRIQFYFFFFAFETVTFRPETFRFKARTTTSTRFDLKLLLVFLKYRLPGKLHFTIFTRKVSTVTFSEGGYTPSRSQNDKTSNIW